MKFIRRRDIHDTLHYWLRQLARRLDLKPPVRFGDAALVLTAAAVASLTVFLLQGSALPQEAVYMAGIFVLAAILWATEALPLFATALLVIGLEIILLANPGSWPGLGFETGASPDYRTFLAPMADPIIILFLGGFLLARAAIREGVDQALAGGLLHRLRHLPQSVAISWIDRLGVGQFMREMLGRR